MSIHRISSYLDNFRLSTLKSFSGKAITLKLLLAKAISDESLLPKAIPLKSLLPTTSNYLQHFQHESQPSTQSSQTYQMFFRDYTSVGDSESDDAVYVPENELVYEEVEVDENEDSFDVDDGISSSSSSEDDLDGEQYSYDHHAPLPSSQPPSQWGAAWYNENEDGTTFSNTSAYILATRNVYKNYTQLKAAVTMYNLGQNKAFKAERKRKESCRLTCLYERCPWLITAGIVKHSGDWIIKKCYNVHSCRVDYSRGGADYNVTSELIAQFILEKIRIEPKYKIKLVQEDVHAHFGVRVSYKKAWYGCVIALEKLYSKWDESYNQFPTLISALKQTNPDSIFELVIDPIPENEVYEFKYFFWAFKAAIDGFKHCLPVITIDGTHLYGKYKGTVLLAIAMNANKEIYPLAYSIVNSENGESWTWFMKLLAQHVLHGMDNVCIISDRHAGIDMAFNVLPKLLPLLVHRRFCLRHLRSNFMTKYKGKRLKMLVWQAGTAVTTAGFKKVMRTIQSLELGAYNYLNMIDPQMWALSHDGGYRHGLMTTNSSESFNNTLKGCRQLPVTAVVQMSYEKLVTMFAERRTVGLEWEYAGLKWPRKIFDEIIRRENLKNMAHVKRFDDLNGTYSIALYGDLNSSGKPNYVPINIQNASCKCGEWEVDGLHCAHVHSVCHYVGKVADELVPDKFSLVNYIRSYEGYIMPLLSEDYWPENWYKLLPPKNALRESRTGPYGSTRIPNEMDLDGRRCTYCRSANHDRISCPRVNRVD